MEVEVKDLGEPPSMTVSRALGGPKQDLQFETFGRLPHNVDGITRWQ